MSWISHYVWETKLFLFKLWLVLRHMPLIKCPVCNGSGWGDRIYTDCGMESGECQSCYDHYTKLVDYNIAWAEGRISPIHWLRIKMDPCGGWRYPVLFKWSIRCRLGFHTPTEHGLCDCCYEDLKADSGGEVERD